MINLPFTKRARTGALLPAAAAVAIALVLLGGQLAPAAASRPPRGPRPTIVLVHGDWADASSWTSVIERLQDSGFTVIAPPNPLRGPGSDSAYIAAFLKTITGPIVLVAHSYGGFVITNAATGNPNVKALVYIDGFMPDEGEVLAALTETWKSCVTESALNPVPSDGAVDLYLRWDVPSNTRNYRLDIIAGWKGWPTFA